MKLKSTSQVLSKAGVIALGSTLAAIALAQDVVVVPVVPVVTPADARTHGLESLRTVVEKEGVPLPNLSKYIKDYTAARQLGKALFHEMAIGSDGVQACVTCHFKAGADPRIKNQVSPGLVRVQGSREGDVVGFFNAFPYPDTTFQVGGPNYTLKREDFPFVRDIGSSGGSAQSNHDAATSQGVFFTYYLGVEPGGLVDYGTPIPGDIFNVGGLNTRRDEPRNTPTMINAVFNFANFWDGRANNRFNGQNPFGDQDRNAIIYQGGDKNIMARSLEGELRNASLASQAVGPPGSHFEMSHGNGVDNGRPMHDIGRKVIPRYLLSEQTVDPYDSLLGPLVGADGKIHVTYGELIQQAFHQNYWGHELCIVLGSSQGKGNSGKMNVQTAPCDPGNYTLMEANFAFIFGVSVMLYEATLVSDASPFDNWMRNGYDSKFGDAELRGLNVFVNEGHCVNCHGGPELTNASVRNAQNGNNVIEPMLMGDKNPGIYDNGFYNIGVTPTTEDLSRGGADPWGRPLAFTRQFAFEALGIQDMPFQIIGEPIDHLICSPTDSNKDLDPLTCDDHILGFNDDAGAGFFPVCRDLNGDNKCGTTDELLLKRVAVDGAFKTPGLRNVAETAPYFHNGSKATLREVVQFYNRGGDFCRSNRADLDPDIQVLGLSAQQEKDLVAFLIALTDERVVKRSAPFDSPSYDVPQGHPGDQYAVTPSPVIYGQAADDLETIPAVGKHGGAPLVPFLGLGNAEQFVANAVTGMCSPDVGAAKPRGNGGTGGGKKK